jgi:hypothetical protein
MISARSALRQRTEGPRPSALVGWTALGPWNTTALEPFQMKEEKKLGKKTGEPGRTRTSNPLIKSQLLYH